MTTAETTIIGDTMETDILGGVQMGYRTVLVLSGGTRREDLARYAYRPDIVVDSIADLCGLDPARSSGEPKPDGRNSIVEFQPRRRRSSTSAGVVVYCTASKPACRAAATCPATSSMKKISLRPRAGQLPRPTRKS